MEDETEKKNDKSEEFGQDESLENILNKAETAITVIQCLCCEDIIFSTFNSQLSNYDRRTYDIICFKIVKNVILNFPVYSKTQ